MTSEYDMHKHHGLKMSKDTYHRKGLSGLVNLGNTCYMNSVIQCLASTIKLTDYFLSRQNREDDPGNMNKTRPEYKLVRHYVTLLDGMFETNQLIKPRSFRDALSHFVKKYATSQQQDSQECLMYILDTLHKGLSYEIDVDIVGEPKTETDKLYKRSLEEWTACYKDSFSCIVDYFHGQTLTKVTCRSCGEESTVFEPYSTLNLSVPMQGDTSLDACLSEFFQTSRIDSWKCSKCKKKGCDKATDLWTVPNYLIVTLKRFDNTNKKINSLVKYDEYLDLTKFMSLDKADPNKYKYTLYAVNCHTGSTSGGHYYALCKNLDGNWYQLNDGDVRKQTKPVVTSDAYILFYYRTFIN
jgi:ubiquitin C-terminal hydrolase